MSRRIVLASRLVKNSNDPAPVPATNEIWYAGTNINWTCPVTRTYKITLRGGGGGGGGCEVRAQQPFIPISGGSGGGQGGYIEVTTVLQKDLIFRVIVGSGGTYGKTTADGVSSYTDFTGTNGSQSIVGSPSSGQMLYAYGGGGGSGSGNTWMTWRGNVGETTTPYGGAGGTINISGVPSSDIVVATTGASGVAGNNSNASLCGAGGGTGYGAGGYGIGTLTSVTYTGTGGFVSIVSL